MPLFRRHRQHLPLVLPALLAAAGLPWQAQAQGDAGLRAAEVQAGGGVDLHYDLASPHDPAGHLQGVVRGTSGEWRGRMRVDPARAAGERLLRLETQWQSQQSGALPGLVVGDTVGSGGGWSRPVRFGGVRLGRSPQLRHGFDTALHARVPGSAALPRLAMDADAESVLAGWPRRPVTLPAGDADYEIEAGRLRSDWGTPDDRYGEAYAAGAWRSGRVGWPVDGLVGEMRVEWTPSRQASGIELARQWGAQARVRAVLAHSATADEAGRRWGVSVVQNAQGAAWTLDWDGYERGFTPLAVAPGEPDPQSRVRAGAAFELRHDLRAGLSFAHEATWGTDPAQVLGLALRYALPASGTFTLTYAQRAGDQAQQRLGFRLDLPLER